jgi:CxxC motif-containing protein (DUF1111 family)
VLALLVATGCDVLLPEPPADDEILDAPLDGLTGAQLRLHLAGDEAFGRHFSAADGLGPLFLASSCAQCHVGEGKGHPFFSITRFGRAGTTFDPVRELGGPQLQHRALPGYPPEVVPPGTMAVSQFMPPAITGLGFLEAVDDTTLLRLADPDDADGDGISGRVQLLDADDFVSELVTLEAVVQGSAPTRGMPIEGKVIGRFGRKASAVNLLHQTVTALSEDMGLTSDLIPRDLLNRQVGNLGTDEVPDPEVGSSTVEALVFYLKTLRQPLRRGVGDADVQAGADLFAEIGCAACHLPTLRTGASEIPQLDRVEFHPYTDLLLHDLGAELDEGYTEGRAESAEWRTTPLWGLGLSARFQGGQAFHLHDGRSRTLTEAIEYHGGEGAASREGFRMLSAEERERLLRFLRSL